MEEGWYLMSARDLELELKRWRESDSSVAPSNALALDIDEALAYRNAGNLPDDLGRSLRLVLHVADASELSYLQEKRLMFEPDFHDAPHWRREGSKPVNVVPLRRGDLGGGEGREWWADPKIAELESQWSDTGMVEGIRVPGEYRSFVYKTVLALRAAGREVTPDSVADSIARWLPAEQAERIRHALHAP